MKLILILIMYNIICLRVPFISAINTYNITDTFLYGVNLTGSYSIIPFGDDNFDLYATGTGNQGGQLFFSGSGFWQGSGYTISNIDYFYETFNDYQTGSISGFGVYGANLTGLIPNSTGLSSGILFSGYNFSTGFLGYTIYSGYLI